MRVDSKVEDGKYLDNTWLLQTRNGIVKARVVVNAAGLYGDQVENMCRPSRFTCVPRLLLFKHPTLIIFQIVNLGKTV